jgi:hypothetical protein
MTEQQVIEGTWEEIARHAEELAASGKRLKLIIPSDEALSGMPPEIRPPGRTYFGMFKGAKEATEDDFKEAEFHGDPDDGLDWARMMGSLRLRAWFLSSDREGP